MPPLLSEGGYHYPEKPEFICVFILLYCSKAASKPWSFKIEAISSICVSVPSLTAVVHC